MRIGFIGLGRMGRSLSERLAKAGHQLALFDLRAATAVELAAAYGGTPASSPAAAVRHAEAVMISVPGPREAEDVMLAPSGILAAAKPGLLVIDTTTATVAQSRDLARRAAALGVDYLDAPISVGGSGAITVMAGGERAAFERALPILDALGANLRFVGPSGSGTAVKLINQSIYVAYMAAFAEGLALGEGFGIPLDALLDALGPAAAGNPDIATKYPEIRGLSANRFAIDSALRYLGFATEAFRDVPRATPILAAAAASLTAASSRGVGAEDIVVARQRYLAPAQPGPQEPQ